MKRAANQQDLEALLKRIRSCNECAASLPYPPRPIVQAGHQAKILIIGQAPGLKVQQSSSGQPFNDASGQRLRQWLGINADTFYNPNKLAIMPMGFCYPGKGKSGDLPPRAECAPLWHQALLQQLPELELTLLIGQYAQRYYLHDHYATLTERVRHWRDYLPHYFVMPHPSPRNQIWLKKNPWFEQEAIPLLQARVQQALSQQALAH